MWMVELLAIVTVASGKESRIVLLTDNFGWAGGVPLRPESVCVLYKYEGALLRRSR